MIGYEFEVQDNECMDVDPDSHTQLFFPGVGVVWYRFEHISWRELDFTDPNWEDHRKNFESFRRGEGFEINGTKAKFLREVDIPDETVLTYFSNVKLSMARGKELSDRLEQSKKDLVEEFNGGLDEDNVEDSRREFITAFLPPVQRSIYEIVSWNNNSNGELNEESVKQKLSKTIKELPTNEDRRDFYLGLMEEPMGDFFFKNNLPYYEKNQISHETFMEIRKEGFFEKILDSAAPYYVSAVVIGGFIGGAILGGELEFDSAYTSRVSSAVSAIIGAGVGAGVAFLSFLPMGIYLKRQSTKRGALIEEAQKEELDNVFKELDRIVANY